MRASANAAAERLTAAMPVTAAAANNLTGTAAAAMDAMSPIAAANIAWFNPNPNPNPNPKPHPHPNPIPSPSPNPNPNPNQANNLSASMVEVPFLQCPSSAPVPPQETACRLWAARHSQEEAGPLGAQPLPRVLERAASKAADGTAFDHAGGFMCQMYIKNNRSGIGGGLGGRGNPEEEGTELLGCMPRGR